MDLHPILAIFFLNPTLRCQTWKIQHLVRWIINLIDIKWFNISKNFKSFQPISKKKQLIGMRERYFEQQTLFTLDHIFRFHYSVSFFSALPSFLFMFLCLSGFLSFLPFPLPFLMCFSCFLYFLLSLDFHPFRFILSFFPSFRLSFFLSFFPSFFLSFHPFYLSFFPCFFPFCHPVFFAFLIHFEAVGVVVLAIATI